MVFVMSKFWIILCLHCWFHLCNVSGQIEGSEENVCTVGGKKFKIGERWVENCTDWCKCDGRNEFSCDPVCGLLSIHCPIGQIVKYVDEPLQLDPRCSCPRPKCVDVCTVGGKKFKIGERWVDESCTDSCKCDGRNEFSCVPVCPYEFIHCPIGQIVKYVDEPLPWEPRCSCPRPKCVSGFSCSRILDLVVILDSSLSVGSTIWPQEVDFAKHLVNVLDISQTQSHVGVIDFSRESIVRVDLNKAEGSSKDSIHQILDNLRTQYQANVTNMDLALASAVKMFNEVPANRHVPKVLIVVTDGGASSRGGQSGHELMRDEIESLKSLNVNRYSIGVGKHIERAELDSIASDRRNVILFSTFNNLVTDIERILRPLCKPPGTIEGCYLDLVVVLDCSGSIGYWNWQRQLNFVRNLVQSFKISQDQTRIGLAVFHENSKVYINITNDGGSKDHILNKLANLKNLWQPYMRTYTDLALNSAVQMIEELRKNIPRIVLLVSDGETSYGRKPLLVKPVQTLASNRVEVFSVGIGTSINFQELLYICKRNDRVFLIKNYKEMIKDINKISTKLCNSE